MSKISNQDTFSTGLPIFSAPFATLLMSFAVQAFVVQPLRQGKLAMLNWPQSHAKDLQ